MNRFVYKYAEVRAKGTKHCLFSCTHSTEKAKARKHWKKNIQFLSKPPYNGIATFDNGEG
jgi:hypothetical protein